MPDPHYEDPKLAELYDLDSGWSEDRDFYLALAGEPPQNILDLGCGTGLLCQAYAARGHRVTGADPAAAMLDVARNKKHGREINWVHCTAEEFKADQRFDLIIMTGHAFQVLVDDRAISSCFSTMRRHLAPGGLIVFESRNPAIDWVEQWDYEMSLQTPQGTVKECRRFLSLDEDLMTFELRYEFPEQSLVSPSQLRFLSRSSIEERLQQEGLLAESVLGDWQGQPFDETSSKEMIFKVRRTD
ncbi:MAG: class I SAM-dependent methyltransferase [Cyanobacteria bacterium SZAS LIN-2]|nr:class I SAM-dependent methyltransferase [Cyanobacteria bacterium SZAS LIN-3]MBS1995394.1 class I SAM-dependent methyltransferase [Cyanobacteria bacterium SZAS LIN-2]